MGGGMGPPPMGMDPMMAGGWNPMVQGGLRAYMLTCLWACATRRTLVQAVVTGMT
jgi:hypothetical protein